MLHTNCPLHIFFSGLWAPSPVSALPAKSQHRPSAETQMAALILTPSISTGSSPFESLVKLSKAGARASFYTHSPAAL
ncbi:hypothetical protein GQ53DRAFT_751672 [Thozetella sp. PMI_491]|nr:hypothetical protein GQ53DRAFT_751672 [Thozetella sp. PMI_491]